ncbi:MAG TPA: phosphate/phosphite/phosphonate ABC transporter substrate-binding protein [Anaerolineales bacterium]|jgi:phosphonate transport system substrate-binding protein|nr:phosphate/phosphite/phosphonate ABC transporter substrate-binding protein [Anaerolineales bacterium]
MNKSQNLLLAVIMILALAVSACAPAATAVPTDLPDPTEAPPTEAPATEAPTEAAATEAPTTEPPTPTPPPPPVCDKLPNAPEAPAAGELGSADNPIVITFVPSGDTGKITTAGTAIADCLSEMTGLNFEMEVGTSFAASIEAMGAEKAQVGFLNTFSALLAGAKYGVTPSLVAIRRYATNELDPDKALGDELQPFYKAQFIANVDSGINSFADLKGKTFCFVDPNSTSGYIIPRIILAANGINPDVDFAATQNAGSHPNVAIAVYQGDCDAGVTFINVLTDASADLKATYPDIEDKVKVFAVSDRIPNDGMQFIQSLDPELKSVIVQGMMAMAEDPGGKAVLKSLYNYDAFQEVDPAFYNEFLAVLVAAGVDPASLVK